MSVLYAKQFKAVCAFKLRFLEYCLWSKESSIQTMLEDGIPSLCMAYFNSRYTEDNIVIVQVDQIEKIEDKDELDCIRKGKILFEVCAETQGSIQKLNRGLIVLYLLKAREMGLECLFQHLYRQVIRDWIRISATVAWETMVPTDLNETICDQVAHDMVSFYQEKKAEKAKRMEEGEEGEDSVLEMTEDYSVWNADVDENEFIYESDLDEDWDKEIWDDEGCSEPSVHIV